MGGEIGLSDMGTASQSPEEFAREFMNAVDEGDFEKAQQLAHSE
jgi:hypothetical protein